MKKTLTLLALTTAALMPMMPQAANGGEDHFVQGITFQEAGNWNTATGWFDANKAWDVDGLQCWAATCSNMIAWWQTQNGYENVNLTSIWNEYRSTFVNDGGIIYEGVIWWLDGSGAGSENWQNHLKAGVTDPGGAHYSEYLDKGKVQRVGNDDIAIISSSVYGAADFSKQLVDYIERGYCVGANFTKNSQGHAKTIWGVSCDDNGLITALYMSDSDDHTRGTPDIAQIQIEPITTRYVNDTLRLVTTNSPAWSLESVVVLNSRLSNDTHYFNILDEESHNIILKQNVNGEGYTMSDTQAVKDIIFDGSRGTQNRMLTVEGGVSTAERLCVNGAGTNTLDVKAGSKLVVGQATGNNTLVKTGAGTLEIQQTPAGQEGTPLGTLDVREGDVVNHGSLGNVAVSGKGRLENDGTADTLTLSDGGVAEMKRSSAAQLFTQCEIEDGGVLKGSGTFGKVKMETGGTLVVGNSPGRQTYADELIVEGGTMVFSIDDIPNSWHSEATDTSYGWGSGSYSTIKMSNKGLTLNPDEIVFVLGSSVLEKGADVNDLADALDTNFTVTLNQVYFLDGLISVSPLLSMSYQSHLDELELRTRFELNSEEANIVADRIQAVITAKNIEFYGSDGCAIVMNATLNVGLYQAALPVPEPTTTTLSLLALAGLCARRRRK